MPRACCVCKAGRNIDSHKFPQDPAKCQKWIEKLQMPELNLHSVKELQKFRVCYRHFSAEDYRPTRGVRQLKNTACPQKTPYTRKNNDELNQDDHASITAKKNILQPMEVQEIYKKEVDEDMDQRLDRTEHANCKKELNKDMEQRLAKLQKFRVCYRHFSAEDYRPTWGVRQLKNTACPQKTPYTRKNNDESNQDDHASIAAKKNILQPMEVQEICKKEVDEDMDQRLDRTEHANCKKELNEDMEQRLAKLEALVLNQAKQQAILESTMKQAEEMLKEYESRCALVEEAISSQATMLHYTLHTGNVKPTKGVRHVKRLGRSNK